MDIKEKDTKEHNARIARINGMAGKNRISHEDYKRLIDEEVARFNAAQDKWPDDKRMTIDDVMAIIDKDDYGDEDERVLKQWIGSIPENQRNQVRRELQKRLNITEDQFNDLGAGEVFGKINPLDDLREDERNLEYLQNAINEMKGYSQKWGWGHLSPKDKANISPEGKRKLDQKIAQYQKALDYIKSQKSPFEEGLRKGFGGK